MKQYTKKWLSAFSITVVLITCAVLLFLLLTRKEEVVVTPDSSYSSQGETTAPDSENYVNIEDNVGAVSFTEDQITELARNIFSLDGFLTNLKVELEDGGDISVRAKIKDAKKLVETYPELASFSSLLSVIEGKDISVSGSLSDNGGYAQFDVTSAKVAGITLNKALLSPFLEEGDFSALFDVEYDCVEIMSDRLVFKNGLPEILQY